MWPLFYCLGRRDVATVTHSICSRYQDDYLVSSAESNCKDLIKRHQLDAERGYAFCLAFLAGEEESESEPLQGRARRGPAGPRACWADLVGVKERSEVPPTAAWVSTWQTSWSRRRGQTEGLSALLLCCFAFLCRAEALGSLPASWRRRSRRRAVSAAA